MPIFIALLRSVNVGGNTLSMERLRAVCAELGVENARTYVQSGNLVFAAPGSAAHWATALERKLAGESRLVVSVVVRTAAAMGQIVAGNPFLKEKGIDLAKLHVTFLQQAPPKTALKMFDSLNGGADRSKLVGEEIYLHCPNGYGRTNLSNNALEKVLGVRATTRNWNTVNKLYQMSAE
ncbi:MAG TPA: DUF1697 domain-containing protein [Burkholderiales bacterium]